MEMKKRVAEIIINELKLKDVTAETFDENLDLIEDLGIDSMELTTIVVVLQDEFGVRIDEDDFSQLTTLAKITSYLEAKKG
jgi:acyl carrier protein